ncbi:trigger factor [Psychrosphaera sp. B3R10]|uniref:Trigger factor n=1 Tax=Psychrosphaera algicola TaxID=3023714 RepID=A0ABT5FJT8_9GAMM|nr:MULTISPECIES: trigger factor [unclassified Psychrosphaera]MBU2880910.1 trigger factor [Psychrosphaera sp. I2R16]MBU2990871.1 trigger factor [Psychrosphaera sp. B3R10]MDC2891457.1 trigger factor [Psychrosphaera sp. G1-22]MDO6720567.1 trigger factor [Psychrosphaera sp. 1_MG-2023]
MQVSLETTQGLERRLTITLPSGSIEELVKKRLREVGKTARIDGFRKGKVPVTVIEKRYGQSVFAEVAQEQMQQNYIQAVIQEKVNPAGAPYFEPKNMKRGEDLVFVATFEIFPEVEVQAVEEIEIERLVAEVTDEDLAKMMETLRKQQASWEETAEAATDGSRVTINFVGKVDGEEFEGGKAEDFSLELGQGRMIAGFEDDIIGKKAGEEVTVNVTFPEEYHAENLKGKDAEFAVTVNKVEVQVLPELNDEFVVKFGIEEGGVDALKEEVKNNMTRELSQALKAKVKESTIKGLLAKNEIDVPKALIDQEVETLRKQAMERFGGQMDPANMPDLPAELFEQQAKDRVRTGLLLGEFIKTNEIKADEDRVKEIINTQASAYEAPEEVIEHYYSNEQLLQNIRSLATEDQAIDLILEKAKVTDKTVSFDEIMNPQQA